MVFESFFAIANFCNKSLKETLINCCSVSIPVIARTFRSRRLSIPHNTFAALTDVARLRCFQKLRFNQCFLKKLFFALVAVSVFVIFSSCTDGANTSIDVIYFEIPDKYYENNNEGSKWIVSIRNELGTKVYPVSNQDFFLVLDREKVYSIIAKPEKVPNEKNKNLESSIGNDGDKNIENLNDKLDDNPDGSFDSNIGDNTSENPNNSGENNFSHNSNNNSGDSFSDSSSFNCNNSFGGNLSDNSNENTDNNSHNNLNSKVDNSSDDNSNKEIDLFTLSRSLGCIFPAQKKLTALHTFSARVLNECFDEELSLYKLETVLRHIRTFNWTRFVNALDDERKNQVDSLKNFEYPFKDTLSVTAVAKKICARSFTVTALR